MAGLYDKVILSFWVFSPDDLVVVFLFCFFTSYFSFRKIYILENLSRSSHYMTHTCKKGNEFVTISIWQDCLWEAISNKIANTNSDTCSLWHIDTYFVFNKYRETQKSLPQVLPPVTPETQRLLIWKPSHEKQELPNFSKWKACISQGSRTG